MKFPLISIAALSFAAFASPCFAAGDKGDVGRYVFSEPAPNSNNRYVLDTKTGRVWIIAQNSEGFLHLFPMPYSAPSVSLDQHFPR